jgi:hypothetical protein
MYISERKLRKIVRRELLNEGYKPHEIFEPVMYGYRSGNDDNTVDAIYIGEENKILYVYIQDAVPEGYKPVPNTEDYQKRMLKAAAIIMGNKADDLKNSNIDELKKIVNNNNPKSKRADTLLGYLSNEKVYTSSGLGKIFEIRSIDHYTTRWSEFMTNTGIELGATLFAGAAALAMATPGGQAAAFALEGLGNTFNLADIANKLNKAGGPDYIGAFFGILGLIPGGDSANIIKKLGGIEVLPRGVAKEIGEFIYKSLDEDNLKSISNIIKSFINDKKLKIKDSGIIIQGLIGAGKEIANSFKRIEGVKPESTS